MSGPRCELNPPIDRSEYMPMIETHEIDASNIAIDPGEVYHLLGYPSSDRVEDKVRDAVKELTGFTLRIITPKYQYTVVPINAYQDDESVVLGDKTVLHGEGIASALRFADEAGIILVTIGQRIVDAIKRMEETDVTRSFFLDATASVAVESLAEMVHLEIAEKAFEKELYVGHRYSPGYCDWDLTQQRILFSLLDGAKIGVRLTRTHLMIPRKSISAIVGLGQNEEKMAISPCGSCRREDCMARRGNYITNFYQIMRSKSDVSL